MKTETQIAEEYVRTIGVLTVEKYKEQMESCCFVHKKSCQRFLEFIEDIDYGDITSIKRKITDLKQAIKLYEDVGI